MEGPPDEVRKLLQSIETYEHLGALLVLFEDRERGWTVNEVSARAKLDPGEAATVLAGLVQASLAREAGERTFRAAEELGPAVDRLAGLYADDPVTVMRELTQNAIDRVRTRAVRTFADAFVLGRKKNG